MYPLKTALQIIRTGKEVDIEACSYDEKRNKMGDRIILKRVTLSTAPISASDIDSPSVEHVAGSNPWHTKNLTMNFRHRNGEITKLHVPLIEKLNLSQVVL